MARAISCNFVSNLKDDKFFYSLISRVQYFSNKYFLQIHTKVVVYVFIQRLFFIYSYKRYSLYIHTKDILYIFIPI